MLSMTSLKASRSSYIDLADITRATVRWAKKCTYQGEMSRVSAGG